MAAPAMFSLTSKAFTQGGSIPVRFTCDGTGVSPPLSWAGLPPGTQSLVLVVTDPDAPNPEAPRMTWVHWIIFDLPPIAGGVTEGEKLWPPGVYQGLNSWKRIGYGGPCPPIGRHHYFFRLYALARVLSFATPPNRERMLEAMRGHVLAKATLVGTYRRGR